MTISRATRGVLVAGLLAAVSGCVQPPLQRVPIHVEPADSIVYVDGSQLAVGTRSIELRSDAPHVFLAKREGYRPEQLVLEPQGEGGARRLAPAEAHLVLQALVPTERAIRIEGVD